MWYDETRAVALAYGAKFEWPDLAQDVKPDPQLAGKAKSSNGKVAYVERLIDNMCMQLVQKPEDYNVIVTSNLYGDILSDLCAGPGRRPRRGSGGNIGSEGAIFEATHGSAPNTRGMNKVNPTALILSAKLMLEHSGEDRGGRPAGTRCGRGDRRRKDVTYDMKANRNDPSAVGTQQMAEAICQKIRKA